jgi:hypothetical protein
MNRTNWGLAGLAAGLLWALSPVHGAITGVFNDLINGKSAADGFVGTWQAPPGGDIDHIAVTASSSGPVRIQVFGRCETRVCNWGVLPARIRTDGPASDVVRSLSADFNLGFALRHITLHRAPGNALRFDMVTEFTDGSERHDYESTGQLVPAGVAMAAAPVPSANAAPAPSAAPPPPRPPAAGAGISALNPLSWFSSKPAPQAAEQPAPQDGAMPVAASAVAPVDDCVAVDAGHLYVASSNGNWYVRDFLHVAQSFGPFKVAANKGLVVAQFYRFDEVCHVGRSTTNLTFLRTAGEVPRQPLSGEDCSDVHPDKVAAEQRDDSWKVVDGGREIFDYGSDREGALQAVSAIKTFNLARQCYYDRANLAASYWLTR